MILRRIARPMLAAVFVSGGLDALRNPKPRVEAVAPVIDRAVDQVGDRVPAQVPTDPELLVKVNAAAQVAAGTALALGRFPRLSAFVLAASLAPTTVAGHRFWEHDDPTERSTQRVQFLKNLGLLGGLLVAAADTHGKPSLSWRARHATSALTDSVQGTVTGAAKSAQGAVEGAAKSARGTARQASKSARGTVRDASKSVGGTVTSLKKRAASITP